MTLGINCSVYYFAAVQIAVICMCRYVLGEIRESDNTDGTDPDPGQCRGRCKKTKTVTDMAGRVLSVPDPVDRVICSGPGALRLLTYLGGQDLIVAVDDVETRRNRFDARPYALANPAFKRYPVFGAFRGFDHFGSTEPGYPPFCW